MITTTVFYSNGGNTTAGSPYYEIHTSPADLINFRESVTTAPKIPYTEKLAADIQDFTPVPEWKFYGDATR